MKILFIISTLILIAGCSFKKNTLGQNQPQANVRSSEIAPLVRSIIEDEEKSVLSKLKATSIIDLKNDNIENLCLEAALKRGNLNILSALISKGITPYHSTKLLYIPHHEFDTQAYDLLAIFNLNTIQNIEASLLKKNFSLIKSTLARLQMSCETLMDLHQQYNLFEVYQATVQNKKVDQTALELRQENLLSLIRELDDCDLANASRKNEWLTDELVRLIFTKPIVDIKSHQMFDFLISLFSDQSFIFQEINTPYFDFSGILRYFIETTIYTEESREVLIDTWLKPLVKVSQNSSLSSLEINGPQYYIDGLRPSASKAEMELFIRSNIQNSAPTHFNAPSLLAKRMKMLILMNFEQKN